jgi:hypothetical protein
MVPDNSGPQDCCCDDYDYLVIGEGFYVHRFDDPVVDDFCGGPKEWEYSVVQLQSKQVDYQVNAQQDSIEVTFNFPDTIPGPKDPCFLFRLRPGTWQYDHDYKTCDFDVYFTAKKIFPLDPFPQLRPEKKVRVTAHATHKTLGSVFLVDRQNAAISYAWFDVKRCDTPFPWSPFSTPFGFDAYSKYYPNPSTTFDCSSKYCPSPINATGWTCQSEDIDLDYTVDISGSHIRVIVGCRHKSGFSFCFPSSVSTKFTISVEEVDP